MKPNIWFSLSNVEKPVYQSCVQILLGWCYCSTDTIRNFLSFSYLFLNQYKPWHGSKHWSPFCFCAYRFFTSASWTLVRIRAHVRKWEQDTSAPACPVSRVIRCIKSYFTVIKCCFSPLHDAIASCVQLITSSFVVPDVLFIFLLYSQVLSVRLK